MADEPSQADATVRVVAIDAIVIDQRLMVRDLHSETVEAYRARWAEGDELPPVHVVQIEGALMLVDGRHRLEARRRAGLKDVTARVTKGDLDDARMAACTANASNGLPLTRAQKHHVVRDLLENEKARDLSDREIARRTGTSHPFVRNVRSQIRDRVARTAPMVESALAARAALEAGGGDAPADAVATGARRGVPVPDDLDVSERRLPKGALRNLVDAEPKRFASDAPFQIVLEMSAADYKRWCASTGRTDPLVVICERLTRDLEPARGGSPQI